MDFFNFFLSFINLWGCKDYVIFGDFNVVLHNDKRLGRVNGFGSASEELCNFVDALDLHDLPSLGSPFTFFGYDQSVARSRIDRFLISDGADAWFSSLIQKVVIRFLLDHLPMTASCQCLPPGFRPFNFFNVWCHDNSLGRLVENTWEDSTLSHRPIWDKLDRIKQVVSRW